MRRHSERAPRGDANTALGSKGCSASSGRLRGVHSEEMHVPMHFLLVATSLAAANAFVPSPTKQLARRPAQPPLGVMMAKKTQVQQKKKVLCAH